jgi:hypothetical protein
MGIFVTKEEREEQRKKDEVYRANRDKKIKHEELIMSQVKDDTVIPNLTDREIQLEILKTNRTATNWIKFLGWVVIIGLILNLFGLLIYLLID